MRKLSEFNPADQRITALDGIRGLGILLVLILHAYYRGPDIVVTGIWSEFFKFGWTGVELFFVLSGFLITAILIKAKNKPNALRRFVIHRAARIIPLYFTILLVCLVASYLPLPDIAQLPLVNFRENFFIFFFYLSNFSDLLHFDISEANKVLGPAWSLAIEQHYYLLWPLVVLKLDEKTAKRVLLVSYISTVIFRLFYASEQTAMVVYHTTFLHLDGIAIGSMLALWLPEIEKHKRNWGSWLLVSWAIVLGVFVFAGTTHYSDVMIQKIGYLTLAVAYATLILCAMKIKGIQRCFNLHFLKVLGKYSYSIYLIHWPFLLLADQFPLPAGLLSWTAFFLCFTGAMVILGQVSWYVLEKPTSRIIRAKLTV